MGIVLADGSVNNIPDEDTYTLDDPTSDEPNVAIFNRTDLTIYGNGCLTVNAYYNDGIASKDGLIIASGTIVVNAVDDGIRMTYSIYLDGSTTGSVADGLYQDGTYAPGSLYTTFTISSITTRVGSGGGGRFR